MIKIPLETMATEHILLFFFSRGSWSLVGHRGMSAGEAEYQWLSLLAGQRSGVAQCFGQGAHVGGVGDR